MVEPTFDKDGYPTEATLRVIRKWDIRTFADCQALLAYVGKAWSYPDRFVRAPRRRREWKGGPLQRHYYLSTGGWSGNESLIHALEKNWMFWTLSWEQVRRGGHYFFRITEE